MTTQSMMEQTTTPENERSTGVIKVLGKYGDVPILWDKDSSESVAIAEKQFKSLREQGYHAYRIDRAGGAQGAEITTFDPQAEEIIMFGQLQGGAGCGL